MKSGAAGTYCHKCWLCECRSQWRQAGSTDYLQRCHHQHRRFYAGGKDGVRTDVLRQPRLPELCEREGVPDGGEAVVWYPKLRSRGQCGATALKGDNSHLLYSFPPLEEDGAFWQQDTALHPLQGGSSCPTDIALYCTPLLLNNQKNTSKRPYAILLSRFFKINDSLYRIIATFAAKI